MKVKMLLELKWYKAESCLELLADAVRAQKKQMVVELT
jgi:hypothetical protein